MSTDTTHGSADALGLLGASAQEYPDNPDEAMLETIPWDPARTGAVVELHCPEFTSLCPKTSQPDFGKLIIRYAPRARLIESKALKMYLFAFRSHGAFHEVTVDRIARDLYAALDPVWIEVKGEYLPRGGISIWPTTRLPPVTA